MGFSDWKYYLMDGLRFIGVSLLIMLSVFVVSVSVELFTAWRDDKRKEALMNTPERRAQAAYEAEQADRQRQLARLEKTAQMKRLKVKREMELKRKQHEWEQAMAKARQELESAEEDERRKYDPNGKRIPERPPVVKILPVDSTSPPKKTAVAPHNPVASPQLTDQQVDAIALKAVTHIGSLPPSQQAAAWQEWQQENQRRYSPNVAAELQARAAHPEQLRPSATQPKEHDRYGSGSNNDANSFTTRRESFDREG